MVRRKRSRIAIEAAQRSAQERARLGGEIVRSRRRRRWTQETLSERAGVSRGIVGRIERGESGRVDVESMQRVCVAVGRPLRLELANDALEEPTNAGHLDMQELILRLAPGADFDGTFEGPVRPGISNRSTDVRLRSRRRRLLVLVECMNRAEDLGGQTRAFDRKMADADEVAVAIGGETPYRVRGCLVVRDTAHNRALLARYPAIFESRFPGSSVGWVAALTRGAEPPDEPGLVWCDVRCTRLFAWRRSARTR